MPYDHVDNFFGFPMQAQNCFTFGGILPFCLPVYLNQQLLLHHFFSIATPSCRSLVLLMPKLAVDRDL